MQAERVGRAAVHRRRVALHRRHAALHRRRAHRAEMRACHGDRRRGEKAAAAGSIALSTSDLVSIHHAAFPLASMEHNQVVIAPRLTSEAEVFPFDESRLLRFFQPVKHFVYE